MHLCTVQPNDKSTTILCSLILYIVFMLSFYFIFYTIQSNIRMHCLKIPFCTLLPSIVDGIEVYLKAFDFFSFML